MKGDNSARNTEEDFIKVIGKYEITREENLVSEEKFSSNNLTG